MRYNDTLTQWLTMDQALLSAEFLGGGAWTLNEAEVYILQLPQMINEQLRLVKGFDHLPIVITLDRT